MKGKDPLSGFTLIEILTVLSMLGLISLVFCRLFLGQAEAHKIRNGALQSQQALRSAMEIINRDLKGVGYPLLPSYFLSDLRSWLPASFVPQIPCPTDLQGAVSVTANPQGADVVSLLLLLPNRNNPTVLSAPVAAGDTSLTLALSPSKIASQYHLNDVVYLGQPAETAVVVGVSGSTLIIDTDPKEAGLQGVKRDYLPETEVGELSLVSYALFTDQNDPTGVHHERGVPLWKRKVNGGGFEPLVEGITEVKVEPVPPSWYRLRLSVQPPTFLKKKGTVLTLQTQVLKR